ncbi:DUF2157 domain-containing protein [Rahnella aquatilis]|uniref:Putative membrane protein n=2 Tax=Rahnella aquatilis TaxID=34038 RepID=H2IY93_RAHAC|nr:DUF2157 domain-containing protein [Rahnella aquatilis]AEX54219.1 putative membrane protein [Rahnella aquatilis CIP 78.65 = ATCC 33071]
MTETEADSKEWMPSGAAEFLCRQTECLVKSGSLTPAGCQRIYDFCGVRPGYPEWRKFLVPLLSLLGLLSLVAGAVFFVAWNWADMPKMAKFALAELLILALAVLVWWRWYDGFARSALLATGLSFGALFALYGQIYQTGADSWELFRAWLFIFLPLALIARQNSLWFCTWLLANLTFQLYYATISVSLADSGLFDSLDDFPTTALYGYLIVQVLCLVTREVLALRAIKTNPPSWLASRWFSRVMVGFLLLMLTCFVAGNISGWGYGTHHPFVTALWLTVLLVGYFFYRYRHPDLCMLTLGTASAAAAGCVLIMQMFDSAYDIGGLFMLGCLMALWLAGCGAVMLHWRRKLYERQPVEVSSSEVALLTEQLRQHGLLNLSQIEEIQQYDHSSHRPWYLRLTLSIGGWVAAMIILFLLILVLYVADLLNDPNAATVIIPSLLLAAVAGGLLRMQGVSKHHIGLAWAIAATCGLCFGFYLLFEPGWEMSVLVGSLCSLPVLAAMALAMRDHAYRFMAITALTFLLILTGNLLAGLFLSPIAGLGAVSTLVACVVIFWLWVIREQLNLKARPVTDAVFPLLYGIPAGLVLLCFCGINAPFFYDLFWHPAGYFVLSSGTGTGIAAGLILGSLYQVITKRTPPVPLLFVAAIFCGTAAFYAPGIGLGMWLLLMARYQGRQGVLAASGCILTLYIIDWYYFLGVSLLQKSLLLFATGAGLLVLAFAAQKWMPACKGKAYANP